MRYIALLFPLMFFLNKSFGQGKANSSLDTVYYLLDTSKTPSLDRLWQSADEGGFKAYFLNCHCYPNGLNPSFGYGSPKYNTIITLNDLKKLNLISLDKLLSIVFKFGNDNVMRNILYFIEPKNKQFVMQQIYLDKPYKPNTVR